MHALTMTLLGLMVAASVQAASHRTFVSSEGTDSGACGPTTPCRTLSYALTETNDGGEVIILKSGGYGDATGGVIIDKSVSIISEPGVFAALAPTSGYNGITIDTTDVNVAIKGLTINGRGGSYGIDVANGASLDLDNVTISNFIGGAGLYVHTPARVTIKRSTFRSMNNGIMVGSGATLLVSGTKLTDIVYVGIMTVGGTSGDITVVTATDTLVRCQSITSSYGFDNWPSFNTIGKMFLDRITVAKCGRGVINEPQTAGATNVIAVSNSFVTDNNLGLVNNGGNTFLSSGNNHVANNGTNTVGTITTGTMLH